MKTKILILLGLFYVRWSKAQGESSGDNFLEAFDHKQVESYDFSDTSTETLMTEILRLHDNLPLPRFSFDDDLKKMLLEGVWTRKMSDKFEAQKMTIGEAKVKVRRLNKMKRITWEDELRKDALKYFILKKKTEYFLLSNDLMENYPQQGSGESSGDDVAETVSVLMSYGNKKSKSLNENKKTKKMNKKQIKAVNKIPKNLQKRKRKRPCRTHKKLVNEKFKESYKFWKPVCKGGYYSTTDKICWKNHCWCVNKNGMFLKEASKENEYC